MSANDFRKMINLMENISTDVVSEAIVPRYIPAGSTEVKDDQSSAVAYIEDRNGVPYGIGYAGKGGRPKWNYRFRTPEQRQKYIDLFFDSIRRSEEYRKNNDRRKTSGAERGLEVGDIVVSSWGYSMTIVDFYEVVELVANNAAIMQKISQKVVSGEAGYSGECIGLKGMYVGNPFRVTHIKNGECKIDGHHASKWDGKPRYFNRMD